jgi:integrase
MVPSRAEALDILAATPTTSRYTGATPRWRLGMALGFGCGCRVGEILGLRPCDVLDLNAGFIRIHQQYQRRGLVAPKTWRGVRTIEVPDLVKVELRRALRDNPPADLPILVGPRSGRASRDTWYEQAWWPALEGAGLERLRYRFHATRHYAVRSMLLNGTSLAEVAEYIGDSIETVQRVYAGFLQDAPRTARAALNAGLAPIPDEPVAEALGDE